MSYEARYKDRFLERGFGVLRELLARAFALAGVRSFAGLSGLSTAHRMAALGILRPAEALARRMLVVMALGIVLPALVARGARAGISPGRNRRAGGFSLTESRPSTTPYHLRRPICQPRPRIRSFDDPIEPAREAPPEGARLIARLYALEALLADPARQARRMARWFSRRRAGARRSPLRLGRPPVGRRTEFSEFLNDAQHFARWAMDQRLDTS